MGLKGIWWTCDTYSKMLISNTKKNFAIQMNLEHDRCGACGVTALCCKC